MIECLPDVLLRRRHPPRYRPVTSGDHLMAKLMGPRLLRPSEAVAGLRPDDVTDPGDLRRRGDHRRRRPRGLGIAAAVRAQRLAAGLSMRALATKAGMSQPFLSNLENSRAMPSIATLYKIADALGVSPRDFLPPEGGTLVAARPRATRAPPRPSATSRARRCRGSSPAAPGRMIEAHTYVVEPGAGLGGWFEHDGEDLLVVARRARSLVEFADGQRYELATGDVLWHVSTLAHRWTSPGRRHDAAAAGQRPARLPAAARSRRIVPPPHSADLVRELAPRPHRAATAGRLIAGGYLERHSSAGHTPETDQPYGLAAMLISTTNHGRRHGTYRARLSTRLLAVTVVLVGVAACGSDDDDAASTAATTATTDTAASDATTAGTAAPDATAAGTAVDGTEAADGTAPADGDAPKLAIIYSADWKDGSWGEFAYDGANALEA